MLEAMRGALRSRRDFDAFNNFLRSENAAQVDEWQKALDDWLEDHSCPDPFRALTTGTLITLYMYSYTHTAQIPMVHLLK